MFVFYEKLFMNFMAVRCFLNPIKYGFFKDKRVGFRTVVAIFVLFSLCFHSSKPPKNEGHG